MKSIIVKPNSDFTYTVHEDFTFKDLVIKKGYKTNGANIPRILWSIFPPFSPHLMPSVIIHDKLCENEEYKKADKYMKESMMEDNVNNFIIQSYFLTCRLYHIIKYND